MKAFQCFMGMVFLASLIVALVNTITLKPLPAERIAQVEKFSEDYPHFKWSKFAYLEPEKSYIVTSDPVAINDSIAVLKISVFSVDEVGDMIGAMVALSQQSSKKRHVVFTACLFKCLI